MQSGIHSTQRSTKEAKAATTVLRSLIDSSPDAALLVDTVRKRASFNARFAEMFGVPAELQEADDVDALERYVLAQLEDPTEFAADIAHFRSDPQRPVRREVTFADHRICEVHSGTLRGPLGEMLGRIWFFRDVSERKRAEAAVLESHEVLAATERIAHVGGWRWTLETNDLVWSVETSHIFGRDPKLPAKLADFFAAVHCGDRDRVQAAIDAALKSERPFDIEFRITRPDGGERIIAARAEVACDASGRPVRMTGTTYDVTESRLAQAGRAEAEKQLAFANKLLTSQMESSPDGILVVGPDRKLALYNQTFVELWQVPDEVIASRNDERAVASVLQRLKDPAGFVADLQLLYTHPEAHDHTEIELDDGRVFERYSGPLQIAEGEAPGRIFFFRDISARKTAEKRIAQLARQDELTGLANRGVFVSAVESAIARVGRGGAGFAIVCLDLDHFKDINDTLGHPIGDALLQAVAHRLRSTVRDTDLVARFGGDEFAILVSDLHQPADVAALANRLQAALAVPFSIHGNEIRTNASAGVAIYGADARDAESLMSYADVALYRAKSDGRGTYRFFTEKMDVEVRARVALVTDLRTAIESKQLFVVYQPQVEIDTGRIVGAEALVRWRHPTRGLVSPAEFIPVAETSGLIVALGRAVMDEACRRTSAWLAAGIAPPIVAVNVSGLQFKTPRELETTLESILRETGLPPERIELELTESVLMDSWFEHGDVLANLREMGVRIAIDDFGTGFSSLDYLSRFPVDRIKIAQTFIAGVLTRPANAAIVRATIGLARELGIDVIAEGVETREQLELLQTWGCAEVQGFYFSRPVPEDAMEALLRQRSFQPFNGSASCK